MRLFTAEMLPGPVLGISTPPAKLLLGANPKSHALHRQGSTPFYLCTLIWLLKLRKFAQARHLPCLA